MTMPGTPGRVNPSAFQPGTPSCTRYQISGVDSERCVSLASSGLPEAVCVPSTTQLLLPKAARICSWNWSSVACAKFQLALPDSDCLKEIGASASGGIGGEELGTNCPAGNVATRLGRAAGSAPTIT